MGLSDKLVAAYLMGNNALPFTQTDYVGGRHLIGIATSADGGSLEGENGPAVWLNSAHGPLTVANASPFIMDSATTMAIRFMLTSDLDSNGMILVSKGVVPLVGADYFIFLDKLSDTESTVNFFLWMDAVGIGPFSTIVTFAVPTIAKNVWRTIVFGFDPEAADYLNATGNFGAGFVIFNSPNPVYTLNTGPAITGSSPLKVGGSNAGVPLAIFNGAIDFFYIWKRILTGDEIVQLQSPVFWPFDDPVDDCAAVPCCATLEPTPYSSSNPSASGVSNINDFCSPVPVIVFDPPSGTTIAPPTYVVLSTNRTDATIFYTIDGTDPDVTSAEYDSPFPILNANTIVKAFAIVDGCVAGAIWTATYIPFSQGNFLLGFLCDVPDLVGQWGVFAPNGSADYHWQLKFTLTGNTDIVRIEMYQTDGVGQWLSGQAWATDEFINPVGSAPHFHVFPLEVWDEALAPACLFGALPPACGQQLNAVYKTDFGTFAAGDYVWDMYGQPVYPLFGFFKIVIFLGNGSVLEQIISTTCTPPPPPPCPQPSVLTLTPGCGKIDITFTETVGLQYQLLRAIIAPCGDQIFRIIASGNVASNPQTIHDTGLDGDCTYCYYICIKYPGCDFICGSQKCAQPLCSPKVSIGANIVEGCHGNNVVLSYSSTCVTGNVTITNDKGGAPITAAGNTSGTTTVPLLANSPASECWTISGSNSCATTTAQTCVAAIGSGCDLTNPVPILQIAGFFNAPGSVMFDIPLTGCGQQPVILGSGGIPWDGTMTWIGGANCTWSAVGGAALGIYQKIGGVNELVRMSAGVNYDFALSHWRLVITTSAQAGGTDTVWSGTKACGKTPLDAGGNYIRDGGCCASPASVIMATP